jgi:hypothetical protein
MSNTLLSLKVKWTVRVSTRFPPPTHTHSAFTICMSLTTLIIISLHCINRLVRANETWCAVVCLVDRISNYNHD